ncbi:Dihydrofolate reductase [Cribrihabitans marinus]|uniref:Dihydrofolate reductase n=1 Tax=Cribrihabitans marinus TaxID=1227549 RepID=A0A1H7C4X2_9RHOB|nr:dihydrofolate reductase family protein [Cribrihabitans marinus]GGH33464.1 hypothetical protein GCM10010973_25590 [Cribrihabitans marinus]SEJ81670.1 Dihydrofolate reductase [Cribrihabitans marinus]
MQSIIYDVAVSVDGFIAGPGGDISGFAREGEVVEAYMARLVAYACAIMGRATYEFGHRFDLTPGQNPYPSMRTLVFSDSLDLPPDRQVELVRGDGRDVLAALRQMSSGPIYLCGGGRFAGSLLARGEIDRLRLKRAPILLRGGTPLFAGAGSAPRLTCEVSRVFEGGYAYQEYAVRHPG